MKQNAILYVKGVQNYIVNIIGGNSGKTSLKISAKAPKKGNLALFYR
jgi:hypothetical protein